MEEIYLIYFYFQSVPEDAEIDDFAHNMKSQVEIFVNRMKSNSSRGRNISNDSSVQTLFMNITSLHSRLLSYIKDMDDKRMWYEQLQDKLTQVSNSLQVSNICTALLENKQMFSSQLVYPRNYMSSILLVKFLHYSPLKQSNRPPTWSVLQYISYFFRNYVTWGDC